MTKHTATPPETSAPQPQQDALDKELDEALDESFPSSDPIAINITKVVPPSRSH